MRHADSFHGTTILAVRHQGRVALAGDGQVTHGHTVVKHRARKVRRLHNGRCSPASPARPPTRSR